MALARIITRSNPCSRQLALDLLGRGYAVEIVSPDSIPDNLADLELRVEEDPGNQLVASVEAHNGGRSASLEFMHRLKAPMADFIRRPPGSGEAVRLPKQSVSINVEQSVGELELPAVALQATPETVSPATKILHDPKLDPDPEEGALLILPPDPSPSLPVEPPRHVAAGSSTLARPTALPTTARPRCASPRHDRAGWSWRVSLALASVVLMAMVLAFGMRQTGKASSQSSGSSPAENAAGASTEMNLMSAMVPKAEAKENPMSPPAAKSEHNSDHTPKEPQVATGGATTSGDTTAGTTTAGSGAMVPRRHGDRSIARDTVTYFDQHTFNATASRVWPTAEAAFRAQTSQLSARRRRNQRKHDGVIAANTATSLNNNPAARTARQDSGIKRSSDLK
ncbi:MAG TPA: hypothetical protein VKD23_01165 [Terriglobales bacterium]|nr:hypothetical protein [Terriglobales bacterium]